MTTTAAASAGHKGPEPPRAGVGIRPPTTAGTAPHAFVQLRAREDSLSNADWTPEQQTALEQALLAFPADKFPPLERYVRVAAGLAGKGVRDVAFRVRWMSETAAGRKRKAEQDASSKKRRERGQSIFAIQPKLPVPAAMPMQQHAAVFAPPQPMMHLDDHGAQGVGGVAGPLAALLEQNYAILNQFKQNMAQYKVNENTDLLVRFRDNILTILSQMDSMQGVMSQMPPLPVRLNVELANNFLPKQPSACYPIGVPGMPPPIGPMGGMPMNGYIIGSMASGSLPLEMPGMQGSMPMSNSPVICMPTAPDPPTSVLSIVSMPAAAPASMPMHAPPPSGGTALAPLADQQAAAVSAAGPSTSQPPGMHWPTAPSAIKPDSAAQKPSVPQPAAAPAAASGAPAVASAAPLPAATASQAALAAQVVVRPTLPQPAAPGQPPPRPPPTIKVEATGPAQAPPPVPVASPMAAAAGAAQTPTPAPAALKQEVQPPPAVQRPSPAAPAVQQHPVRQQLLPSQAPAASCPQPASCAAPAVPVKPEGAWQGPVPAASVPRPQTSIPSLPSAAGPPQRAPQPTSQAVKPALPAANGKTATSSQPLAATPASVASPTASQGMTTRRALKNKTPGSAGKAAGARLKVKTEPPAA